MKSIRSRLALVVLAACLGSPAPARAGGDGLSFFERFVVVEGGVTRLRSARSAELPPANAALVACRDAFYEPEKDACLERPIALLEQEWRDAGVADVKAGRSMTLALVQVQRTRYVQALDWMTRAVGEAESPLLLGPALHWKLQLDLQLGRFPAVVEGLERLGQVPGYHGLPVEFSTYELHFCRYGGGDWCHRPLPLADFRAQRSRLEQAVLWSAALEGGAPAAAERGAYARSLVELGRTYEHLCPSDHFFAVVCPDAVELFRRAYPEYRDEPGVDYAMLQLQRSQFSYEYEGDEVARSRDVVLLYGFFLEAYPESPHAAEVRPEYERALEVLDRSGAASAD